MCVSETPYYHITSRCVRRAFLCGVDHYTGNSYEHRRAWIEERLRVLSSLFSIDICAYAVMSNHYHLVVHLNPGESTRWSDDEVLDRWTALFRGPLLVQRYRAGEPLIAAECDSVRSIAAVYRSRLGSLSWFMKCLNEPIARKANAEDRCTGHFWEARFHSQALRSEQALLTAMAYVDLNPVRARVAKALEDSEYTSIKVRLSGDCGRNMMVEAISRMIGRDELNHFDTPLRPLMRFADIAAGVGDDNKTVEPLPISELEYLRLVDSTGRIAKQKKRGRIDPALTPLLQRLELSAEQWIQASTAFEQYYRNGDVQLKRSA